jgi:hypothetical protein
LVSEGQLTNLPKMHSFFASFALVYSSRCPGLEQSLTRVSALAMLNAIIRM